MLRLQPLLLASAAALITETVRLPFQQLCISPLPLQPRAALLTCTLASEDEILGAPTAVTESASASATMTSQEGWGKQIARAVRRSSTTLAVASMFMLGSPRGASAATSDSRGPASGANSNAPTFVERTQQRGAAGGSGTTYMVRRRQRDLPGTQQAAFLGVGKKEAEQETFGTVDLNKLFNSKELKGVRGLYDRFGEKKLLFEDEFGRSSPLEEELEQLALKRRKKEEVSEFKLLGSVGGALGFAFVSVQIGSAAQSLQRKQELRDIEEEKELTGGYIEISADDVETAIDPLTGKNLTITANVKQPSDEDTVDEGTLTEAVEPTLIDKFLGVIGVGGGALDEDDFWDRGAVQMDPDAKKPKLKPTQVDGDEGGDRPPPPVDDDDDGDDDTSGMDVLGGLL